MAWTKKQEPVLWTWSWTLATYHMHYEESLNSDGHQFHQYFKKKLSPVLLTEPTVHKKDHGI